MIPLSIGVIGYRCALCTKVYPVGRVHDCRIESVGVASVTDAPKDKAA